MSQFSQIRTRAAWAKETAPGQARHALDNGAGNARERGPLAAGVGALVAAPAVPIIWKRGKRS